MPTPAEELAQAQLAEAAEWGTYTAAFPVDIAGVRAFNVGNPVPASHVERGVVDASLVTKVANPPKVTKAAAALPATVIGA